MISVIVPVFNVQNYISECIDSVLAQSFNDWELILVNDGSIDDSGKICNQYVEKDCRIRVLNKKNGGVTAARRDGIYVARGEWVTFLDSDDKFKPEALETLFFKADGYDIVNASFTTNPNGTDMVHRKLGELKKEEYLKSLIKGETYGVVYASLYRRELFCLDTFGFSSDIKIGEDVLMKIELGRRANKILNISDVIYLYNQNTSSVMNTYVRALPYYVRWNDIRNSLLPISLKHICDEEDIQQYISVFLDCRLPYKKEWYVLLKEKIEDKSCFVNLPLAEKLKIYLIYNIFIILVYKRVSYLVTYIYYMISGKKKLIILE